MLLTVANIAEDTCGDCPDVNTDYVLDYAGYSPDGFNRTCSWEYTADPATCDATYFAFSVHYNVAVFGEWNLRVGISNGDNNLIIFWKKTVYVMPDCLDFVNVVLPLFSCTNARWNCDCTGATCSVSSL